MTQPAHQQAALYGHMEAFKRFCEQQESGRLHHAFLITGPRGVGKATFAFQCAKYLVMQGQPMPERAPLGLFEEPKAPSLLPPEEHPAVRKVSNLSHPDVMLIQREADKKEISVEQVRAVKEFFAHTASEAEWRVVIVDSADELNNNAANSLLKALEEPPQRGVLMLVNHAPHSILPTIRSRCQVVALAPLKEAECKDILKEALQGKTKEEIHFAYILAEGSAGVMQECLDLGGYALFRNCAQALLEGKAPKFTSAQLEQTGFIPLMRRLLAWVMLQQARAASGIAPQLLGVAEEEVLYHQPRHLHATLALWEHSLNLFQAAEGLHLDTASVMQQIFHKLAA